jgi:hypothetical protein
MPPSGYLDTNLVSGAAKQDLNAEAAPFLELLQLRKKGAIVLVTSPHAKTEIEEAPPEKRVPDEVIYALLDDVPTVDEQVPGPQVIRAFTGGSRFIVPTVVYDAVYGQLREILPDEMDARHIFQAAKNGHQASTDAEAVRRLPPPATASSGGDRRPGRATTSFPGS